MAPSSLRWGRIVLGGFLAELVLIATAIPLYMTGAGELPVTVVAVAGSFLVFLPIAWWLCRSLPRPILHGLLMGAAAAAIYLALQVVQQTFDPNASQVPAIYYFAHVLKLAGGATGGWLAQRRSVA